MTFHPSQSILILMDGLRPEPVARGLMPTLSRMAAEGAATLAARSVMPSITLPCIASIFLSVPPAEHGTITNTWTHSADRLPGLFEMAHAGGLQTACFHGWDPLRDLSRPEVLDFCFYHRSGDPLSGETEREVCAFAGDWIAAHRPGFSFLYIELPDQLGHKFGFLSPEYLQGCTRLDTALASFLQRLEQSGMLDETLLVLTADHGGHERSHGSEMPEDMTVPLVLRGPGVRPGCNLKAPVGILDIAPTITHLLGLGTPPGWQGHVLAEALL
jgi:predicted AlkP superfamily pyrophosphatase or phosphodiesterase